MGKKAYLDYGELIVDIETYWLHYGMPPAWRELIALWGVSQGGVTFRVAELEKRGLIERKSGHVILKDLLVRIQNEHRALCQSDKWD